MPDPGHDAGSTLVETMVGFARALRHSDLTVGTGDAQQFVAALGVLDAGDLVDLYWAGRASLVSRHDQIPVYDAVFRHYFLGAGPGDEPPAPFTAASAAEAQAVLQLPETQPGEGGEREDEEVRLGYQASATTALRSKSFASCTPEELAALRRIVRTMRLTPPRRRSRRTTTATAGRSPDLRRTVRQALRTQGEITELHWRRRRLRLRPVTLILDVSGSMADYSRHLLQFAHTTSRVGRRVEVFCFGTRLTRITRELEHRRPDEALERAAQVVLDWDGGTRIGDSLDAFVRTWARRGRCRGGIVVVCSDGLDRGDPAVLARAMEQLSRLCHRIVWVNPHVGETAERVPPTLGMAVAAPYVDLIASGRDLRSLERLAARLPELG